MPYVANPLLISRCSAAFTHKKVSKQWTCSGGESHRCFKPTQTDNTTSVHLVRFTDS